MAGDMTMNTFTIIHHNGWDYYLEANGQVMSKAESSCFWESHLGNLPQMVKDKLGVTERTKFVAASCVIKSIWK